MQSHRADLHSSRYPPNNNPLWDHLHAAVPVTVGILLLTIIYQSYHSGDPFHFVKHPGDLVWNFIVAITPAKLLYALDRRLHPSTSSASDATPPDQPTTFAAKSDLLRRILNMDSPKSFISAVANAGRNLSPLSNYSKRVSDRPPGLQNYDNSCFQNSILQGLSSLQPLPAYLDSALENTEAFSGNRADSSVAMLRELLSKLTDSRLNGTTLWTPQKLKSLDTWQQQDAQEYFSKILDEVDKEVLKAAAAQRRTPGLEVASLEDDTVDSQHSDDSGYHSQSTPAPGKAPSETKVPRNPLEGLVAQRVACVQCGYSEGLSMIPFNCITLSLGVGQSTHDLYERLDSYTALESIDGVFCGMCTLLKVQRLLNLLVTRNRETGLPEEASREPLARLDAVQQALEDDDFEEKSLVEKCGISKQHLVPSTKTKQMVIGRPPASLAIHINRSVFNERTGEMFKNPAVVRFPSTLDLGPWCLGSAGSHAPNVSDASMPHSITEDAEHWISDPKSSMVSGDLRPSKISGPIYELRAVVTHQGRHENGHYVCFRKHPYPVDRAEDDVHKNESDSTTQAETQDSEVHTESKWWRLSDESVWEVTEEAVLSQTGVFMLFYDCVDQNPVLMSKSQDMSCDEGELIKSPLPLETDATVVTDDNLHDTQPVPDVPQSHDKTTLSTSTHVAKLSSSCLYPFLRLNDDIDPMIPIHWPNS